MLSLPGRGAWHAVATLETAREGAAVGAAPLPGSDNTSFLYVFGGRDADGLGPAFSVGDLQGLVVAEVVAVGAAIPLVVAASVSLGALMPTVSGISLVALAGLGGLGAYAGGADVPTGAWRVTLWGVLAMALTSLVGGIFGAVVP